LMHLHVKISQLIHRKQANLSMSHPAILDLTSGGEIKIGKNPVCDTQPSTVESSGWGLISCSIAYGRNIVIVNVFVYNKGNNLLDSISFIFYQIDLFGKKYLYFDKLGVCWLFGIGWRHLHISELLFLSASMNFIVKYF
jgi:hypothetical protein